jgi:ankyrin repeat protein
MNKRAAVVIAMFFILQITTISANAEIEFSKSFINQAKNLGITLKDKSPAKHTNKSLVTNSTLLKPKPEINISTSKQKQEVINSLQHKEQNQDAIVQPVLSKKSKYRTHTIEKGNKFIDRVKGEYFPSVEEGINHKDISTKNIHRRKIYNYEEDPPNYLIERQKNGEESNLPKFMMKKELSQLLFIAVNNQDIGSIKGLLLKGANINAQDEENNYTPLMYAVKNNKIDSLRYLLVRGANPNICAKNNISALHLAAILNRTKALKILLESNADIFAVDKYNKTFYQYINKDYLSIIISDFYETKKNANIALIEFCMLGSVKGAMYALQKGANINAKDDNGDTPLIISTLAGNPEMVTYLLTMGADSSIKNRKGHDAEKIAKLNNYNNIYSIIETIKFNKELYILGLSKKIVSYPLNRKESALKRENQGFDEYYTQGVLGTLRNRSTRENN